MASAKFKEKMHEKRNRYIYHLPYSITRQISQNLDIDNAWQSLAGEIGYTLQQVRVFEMASRTPGQSPAQTMLSDWQSKNPTAQDLHDKLHKINRRREMQILDAWFSSEADDSHPYYTPKKNNSISNDDRTSSQIQAALDNFDSKSFKPPGKGQNKKSAAPKVEDANINLNRCDTFKDKMEMGSKHLDGGLMSKPVKKQMSKEVESEDKTIMHEMGINGPGKSIDNMAANMSMAKKVPSKVMSSAVRKSKESDQECSLALNGIHMFSYKEIAQSTNGFSDDHLIGQGAYGKVFHAVLKNTKCAVKKLLSREEVSENVEEQVKRELANLSKYRHNNIVLLYGYMIDQPDVCMADVCLVYQLMPNGSLEDRLARKNNTLTLSWKQRLGIMRGAACGLQFLHTLTDTPLIHGDIKSGNILLDRNFEAKISDLGMAQHATSRNESGMLTHITKKQADTKQYQTRAYLPPEAQRGSNMSVKGDTYSFGVVMYEVCTGEKAFDDRREGTDAKFLVEYVQDTVGNNEEKFYSVCDPCDKNIPQDLYNSVFKLAQACTSKKKKDRPEMKQVFTDLEIFEGDFENRPDCKTEVCESTFEINQTMNFSQQSGTPGYVYIDPTSLDPHLASMLSQIPPGAPIPESLLLQMGYDQILHGDQVNNYVDEHVKQKLTEMKKFDEEFNGTKAMDFNEEGAENNEDQNLDQIEGHEVTNSEHVIENSEYTADEVNVCINVENQSESQEQGIEQEEIQNQIDLEQQRLEREQKRKENLKPDEEDPEKVKEVIKTRNNFFAQFEQLRLEAEIEEDAFYENEEDGEIEDYTPVNVEGQNYQNTNVEHSQNYLYTNVDNRYDERCDSNQLFDEVEDNVDMPCENTEEEDYEENLDVHRQKFDTYQIIAREMSDENGEVVGEIVDTDQRLYEGDFSENENSFSNNFETVSVETEQVDNITNFKNNNVNVSPNQFVQSNFPWQLQRRSEATESECYV